MSETILIRIEGADATAAFTELTSWLEARTGFRLTPELQAPLRGLRGDGAGGRLARFERIYGAVGSTASLVGLLMAFAPYAGGPESPPPRAPTAAEYEQLVEGASQLLDKLRELGCEREFTIDLVSSGSGSNLRLSVRTAPADLVKLCLQARSED
jgi:hypothetical protein